MIVVHAGNRVDAAGRATPRFPAVNEVAVHTALRATLQELQPRIVVSAAAAGADLLILDAAEQLGIATAIVLPLAVDDFRQRSVDDLGSDWTDRYHTALDTAELLVVVDLSQYDDWYLRGNAVIIDHAQELGVESEEVVAVVVSNLQSDAESATAHFAKEAEARGLATIAIDPMANPGII